jgi:hypothetical protein
MVLEWREREHEEDNAIAGNHPPTIAALRNCGLLKYFRIPGMRAQVRLLEYLVRMWDPDQQVFHVGVHTLSLDIEDIYFLTGLSWRGHYVSLTGSRGGGLPMSEYCRIHCVPEAERKKGKVAIWGVRGFDPPYYLVHHSSDGGELRSSHGATELLPVCDRVY